MMGEESMTTQWCSRCRTLVLTTVLLLVEAVVTKDLPTWRPLDSDMKVFRDTEIPGTRYFRYLNVYPSKNRVYVGAMEYIYQLSADDISRNYKRSARLSPRQPDLEACQGRYVTDSQDFQCKNHIRNIYLDEKTDRVKACGTGAHYPMEFELPFSLLTDAEYPPDARGTGILKCPYDPNDSYTCLVVKSGNPGPSSLESVYTATIMPGLTSATIYRPQLDDQNTIYSYAVRSPAMKSNDVWMNEAIFVASFDSKDYVYFFFKEKAVERENSYEDGKYFSRVGRVCKSDLGGKNFQWDRTREWTSYVKASLNCSVPGAEPFYFHDLRDVYKKDNVFYGLFGTFTNVVGGSAVCRYTEDSINRLFETSQVQEQVNGCFQAVDPRYDPRPGTCVSNSTTIDGIHFHFLWKNPLMTDWVPMQGAEPMFYVKDFSFTKMVVDYISASQTFRTFYLTTNEGKVQVVAVKDDLSEWKSISVWEPFDDDEVTVWSMKLSNGYIYMGTDSRVVQMSTMQCSHYYMCTDCVQDPMCGWNQIPGQCEEYRSGLYQEVFGDPFQMCNIAGACHKPAESLAVRIIGDPFHLTCESRCETSADFHWYHIPRGSRRTTTLVMDGVKYVPTLEDHGLIVMNASKADAGEYGCLAGSVNLARYNVSLPECTDPECVWKTEFTQWCDEFDVYRKQFNTWKCLQDSCTSTNNCMPNEHPQCFTIP